MVGVSSLGAYLLVTRGFKLAPSRLQGAMLGLLEIVGTAMLFFIVNLAVGLVVLLAWRLAARAFVSMYLLNDVSLVELSTLQALLFDSERRRAGRSAIPRVLDTPVADHGGALR